jgi:adenine-specific DNA methylase
MKTKALMAQTHPAEYLIHKYWARKPHNILRHYLKSFFKKGDLVADPFCGSGVFLAEAKKLGIDAIGMDINPIAYLISEVTTNPPDIRQFDEAAQELIEYAKKTFGSSYKLADGSEIRYLVHQVTSKCSGCGRLGSIAQSKKKSSRYYCNACDHKLSFNFENFSFTDIIKIIDKNNNIHETAKDLKDQKNKAELLGDPGNFDQPLVVNRRILAFPDMKLSDLFTPRAYTVLSHLFERAHKIKDARIKNAILLFLTSGSAQYSRLIPFRNNLKTGGPAWTIPGFWIAPLHLETNPLIHLGARYKKFLKGLKSLNEAYKDSNASVEIENISAQDGLEQLKDNSLDGIFFDPPYGDNVPYMEFSAIWNGFLRNKIDYSEEIVVSDRKSFASSWDKYESDIKNVISLFFKKLKPRGKIIMTFNNLDPRAWKIVLEAFSKYSFYCQDAKYQIPAVVSSKAQTAADTSYVGDYYCVFEKQSSISKKESNLYYLTEKMKNVLLSRDGKAPINLLHRVAILSILNDNLPIDFIEKIEDAIKPIAVREGNHYLLRKEASEGEKYIRLEDILKSVATKELSKDKKSIQDFYEVILAHTDHIGSPQVSEMRDLLKGIVLFDGEYCYLQRKLSQAPLFQES